MDDRLAESIYSVTNVLRQAGGRLEKEIEGMARSRRMVRSELGRMTTGTDSMCPESRNCLLDLTRLLSDHCEPVATRPMMTIMEFLSSTNLIGKAPKTSS